MIPLALQHVSPEEWRKLIQGLLKFLAFFVFIAIPIVRSVLESRRKARERAAGQAGPTTEERRAAATEARRRWEALLRGESPEAEAAAPAAPPALPRPPPPIPARADLAAEPAPPPLVAFDTAAPAEDDLEAEVGGSEERRAREELDRRLREERARREVAAARPAREEPVALPELDARSLGEPGAPETTAPPRRARARHRLGDLRRAMIASEILGPPVSGRGAGGARAMFGRDEGGPW